MLVCVYVCILHAYQRKTIVIHKLVKTEVVVYLVCKLSHARSTVEGFTGYHELTCVMCKLCGVLVCSVVCK